MIIDWNNFTPWTALAGGLLVGLAAAALLLLGGRVAPLPAAEVDADWAALAVATPAYALAQRRRLTLLGAPLQLPAATRIDRRLMLGSAAFGAGWGLAGYCPGPAVASLASGGVKPWLFFLAMVAGMGVYELLERRHIGRLGAA